MRTDLARTSRYSVRDGRVVEIRAIRPGDKTGLAEHFQHLSPASTYFRFFAPRRKLADKELAKFIEVDIAHRAAVVATAGVPEGERVIGVAQYDVTDDPVPRADIAVSVVDEYQGLGIGTRLLGRLLEIARSRRISEFQADVLGDNHRMLKLLKRSGLVMRRAVESGVVHFTFSGEAADRLLPAA